MTLSMRLFALLLGFCLDLIFGDPHWLPHPVRAIGALISLLEKGLRKIFPKSPSGELLGGGVLVALVLGVSTLFTWLVIRLCGQLSIWLAFAAETLICYQLPPTCGRPTSAPTRAVPRRAPGRPGLPAVAQRRAVRRRAH